MSGEKPEKIEKNPNGKESPGPASGSSKKSPDSGKESIKEQDHERAASIIAIVILAALVLVEHFTSDTRPFVWLTEQAYEILQNSLRVERKSSSEVRVIDISKWTTASDMQAVSNLPGFFIKPDWPYTDRRALEQLVTNLAQLEPAAIGIDIDFSPITKAYHGDGRPPPYQIQFFDVCTNLWTPDKKRKINVFLGVARTIDQKPDGWLNSTEHTNLAAGIVKFSGMGADMPSEIKASRDSSPLLSLSKALSCAYHDATDNEPERPPRCLQWLLSGEKERTIAKGTNEAWVSSFPVDYSTTYYRITNKIGVIPAEDFRDLTPEKKDKEIDKIRGCVVIIGNADQIHTSDKVSIPGEPEPVPGIFMHACATATLLERPLFEIKDWVGLFVSSLFSIFIFLFMKRRRKKWPQQKRRLYLVANESVVVVVVVFVSFVLAFLLARCFQILWLQVVVLWAFLVLEWLLHLHIEAHQSVKARHNTKAPRPKS